VAEPARFRNPTPAIRPAGELARRLRRAGIVPGADPFHTWCQLRGAEGRRATVVDLYALAAAPRGIAPEQLPLAERGELAARAMRVIWPGFEVASGSDRDPDPVSVVRYDPGWPERYGRWHDRLSAGLGAAALRIDHVGSTSVPGLAAKPTIDIQISVAKLDDEDAYHPALAALGLVLRSRDDLHRFFRPPRDRVRDVHVHVCESGGAWEREHLLFRDHLRAHPQARALYAKAKQEAVARWGNDRIAYGEAKSDVILDQLAAAERWAARTGWSPDAA
jgi:GrpB-like predicted nucleotidyltransferase (UPF0157 family)